eukprot:TRINITY_DN8291_c0_g1_i1.p1 TRINITY_DN8291_c0_g1~~TRINITY_DN8291_c0_g1_i1.p1  ORF type:complete len:1023 (+),score=230.14 TRINITY_DN8291_c0_g1_i1:303-3071(+)
MEKILEESDEAIIVYVSPTKALLRQTVADIASRLTKSYAHGGMSLSGYYTKEYQNNALFCQILVTLPSCLEILLLSPEHTKWASRIQYVIFDEFHSIGSSDEGAVWERLFQYIRCPFLALSATVSNIEQLKQWMENLGGAQTKRTVQLVTYTERYSDLKKWVYLPTFEDTTQYWGNIPADNLSVQTLPGPLQQARGNLVHLHPVSTLQETARVRFSSEMDLSGDEALMLYDAMSEASSGSDWASSGPGKKLRLETFFAEIGAKGTLFLSRPQAKRWQAALKAELKRWFEVGEPWASKGKKVVEKLTSPLVRSQLAQKTTLPTVDTLSIRFITANLLGLLLHLKDRDMLPCLIFHFDAFGCEVLATKILTLLQEKEQEKIKKNQVLFNKQNLEYERRKKDEKRKRDQEAMEGSTLSRREKEKAMAQSSAEAAPLAPMEEDPAFSFVEPGADLPPGTLNQVRNMGGSLAALLVRGIGLHFASLPKKYRDIVEMLFRLKYLRVVLCTETLALGVNMPCRTVVYSGDNLVLDPLCYRQTSGRAGRRGFDFLGHVVFFGIRHARVAHLLTAPVPSIRGVYYLSPTTVMRLLVQNYRLAQTNELALKSQQEDSSRRVLGQPLTAWQVPEFWETNRGLIALMEQVVSTCRLVEPSSAQPVGLVGLACRFYDQDPSNFALMFLMDELEEVASGYSSKRDEEREGTLRSVLQVVAHLFNRRLVSPKLTISERPNKTLSKVVLDPLPPYIHQRLEQFNSVFLLIQKKILSRHPPSTSPRASVLPLSGVAAFQDQKLTLDDQIWQGQVEFSLRSPFAAASGLDDECSTIEELAQMMPGGALARSSLPYLDTGVKLNALVVDFFVHGQLRPLVQANGLRAGEVWSALSEWNHTLLELKRASTALSRKAIVSPDLALLFTDLSSSFAGKFQRVYK